MLDSQHLSDVILVIISIFFPFPLLTLLLLGGFDEDGDGACDCIIGTNIVLYNVLLYFIGVELLYNLPVVVDVTVTPEASCIVPLRPSDGTVTL